MFRAALLPPRTMLAAEERPKKGEKKKEPSKPCAVTPQLSAADDNLSAKALSGDDAARAKQLMVGIRRSVEDAAALRLGVRDLERELELGISQRARAAFESECSQQLEPEELEEEEVAADAPPPLDAADVEPSVRAETPRAPLEAADAVTETADPAPLAAAPAPEAPAPEASAPAPPAAREAPARDRDAADS